MDSKLFQIADKNEWLYDGDVELVYLWNERFQFLKIGCKKIRIATIVFRFN